MSSTLTRGSTWTAHHAVLFLGDRVKHEHVVHDALKTGGSWGKDPDVIYLSFDDMSISDARALRARAYELPIIRDVVTFVITAHSINREAQNALLKLFEDPPRTARFVVLLEKNAPLLATLRSRFFCIEDRGSEDTLLGIPSLKESASLLEKIKDDDNYRSIIRRSLASLRTGKHSFSTALLTLEIFTDTKGASQKMLIEHTLLAYYEDKIAGVAKGTTDR